MRKLFKGGKYSREETIRGNTVDTLTKIKMRPVFKGGNYSREETINY